MMKKSIYTILFFLCFTLTSNEALSSNRFDNMEAFGEAQSSSAGSGLMAVEVAPPLQRAKVLSIDGGGIKNILSLMFLAKLEEETGKRCSEIFDVIAGTSGGGMTALALSFYSAQQVLDLFIQRANEFLGPTNIFYFFVGPKHPSRGRTNLFNEFFGDKKLSDAVVPTLVTAYDFGNRKACHLYSKWPEQNDFDQDYLDMSMVDAAMATTAAPTYFAPATVRPTHVNGIANNESYTFLDGGLFADNPSMLAMNYALKLHPQLGHENIDLLSLGTGYKPVDYNIRSAKCWGAIRWLKPLIGILPIASNSSNDIAVKLLLQDHYDRVDTQLVYGSIEFDKGGDNIQDLQKDGANMILQNQAVLDKWAAIVAGVQNAA